MVAHDAAGAKKSNDGTLANSQQTNRALALPSTSCNSHIVEILLPPAPHLREAGVRALHGGDVKPLILWSTCSAHGAHAPVLQHLGKRLPLTNDNSSAHPLARIARGVVLTSHRGASRFGLPATSSCATTGRRLGGPPWPESTVALSSASRRPPRATIAATDRDRPGARGMPGVGDPDAPEAAPNGVPGASVFGVSPAPTTPSAMGRTGLGNLFGGTPCRVSQGTQKRRSRNSASALSLGAKRSTILLLTTPLEPDD